jgi:hypothetical protein
MEPAIFQETFETQWNRTIDSNLYTQTAWQPVSLCHRWITTLGEYSKLTSWFFLVILPLELPKSCDYIKGGVPMKHYENWAPIGLNYVCWFIRPVLKNRRGRDPCNVAFTYCSSLDAYKKKTT